MKRLKTEKVYHFTEADKGTVEQWILAWIAESESQVRITVRSITFIYVH